MKILVIILLSSLLFSCAHYSPIYWGWGEWDGVGVAGEKAGLSAGLDWSKRPGVITAIDGKSIGSGYKKAKLLPGRHVIEYAYYTAQFGAHPKGIIELDVQAGHSYQFDIKLCFWCNPRKFAVWVYDNTVGTVVWGEQPDWPSWWL